MNHMCHRLTFYYIKIRAHKKHVFILIHLILLQFDFIQIHLCHFVSIFH